MKYAVGYQPLITGTGFAEMVGAYRESVSEVFFPWPGAPSGRPPLHYEGIRDAGESEKILLSDLRRLKRDGIALDFLLNANCYGDDAVSVTFEREILRRIEVMTAHECRPDIVTTASLFVARTIKAHEPDIEVRASVNMRIGTIQAMGYVAELFDSFYIQRDYQRNPAYVKSVSEWCHQRAKKLCMLVNSGCLRFCPGQVFHDNLIAHCVQAEKKENVQWNPHVCWNLYADRKNWSEFLKSTWIRPEDVRRYDGIVDVCKLATRQHSHPQSVIAAYAAGCWHGNLLELTEPGFASLFGDWYIDNDRFPAGFFEKTGRCIHGCTHCGYCEKVLEEVMRRY